jgi:arsenite-transporting ATPase
LAAADRGVRTVLVSTDAAHSLADVLQTPLGCEPVPVGSNLDALHLDGRHELQRTWGGIVEYVHRLLGWSDLDRLRIDELMVIPGLEQLVALARLRALVQDGRWDAMIVDCAPSADSLRLLSIPDVLRWYIERVFPRGSMNTWVRRRLADSLAIPTPDESVISSLTDLTEDLSRLKTMLDEASTTARVVVTPERVVIAEGQRTLAYLALYGYAVDAVVVNRAPCHDLEGTVLAPWLEAQRTQLEAIDGAFGTLPRLTVEHRLFEPVGTDALRDIAGELYRECDPLARLTTSASLEVVTAGRESTVRIFVPGVKRDDIELNRRGDELVVDLGAHRRAVMLPDALRGREVVRAGMSDQYLEVVFGDVVRV